MLVRKMIFVAIIVLLSATLISFAPVSGPPIPVLVEEEEEEEEEAEPLACAQVVVTPIRKKFPTTWAADCALAGTCGGNAICMRGPTAGVKTDCGC